MDNPNPTEDIGYAFVMRVAAENGAIWRPLAKDVGVDGLLELKRVDGRAAFIAVQVKCGRSYFERESMRGYTIQAKRLAYWESLVLPVILVLVNPTNNNSCWVDVQKYCRDYPNATAGESITVPKAQRFDEEAFTRFRNDARAIHTPVLDRKEIADFLETNRTMTFSSLVTLAKAALNGTVVTSRTGIPEVEILTKAGMLLRRPGGNGPSSPWLNPR